jgi:acetoin utilization deacetylase AcuC-like enzyme
MKAVYDARHEKHYPKTFIVRGQLAENPEKPERAARLLASMQQAGHEIVAPDDFGMAPIGAIHSTDYLQFLKEGLKSWQELPGAGNEMVPNIHPNRFQTRRSSHITGQAGYHMADTACPIGEGTWTAAYAAAQSALTAVELVLNGEKSAYALCRPPGHHAFADMAGGFCFINNVAVAAEHMITRLRQQGRPGRVAILDVDVHHGNGTQYIFYHRPDVYFVSQHADPDVFYPFFCGYADERGDDEGRGYNLNIPMPRGAGDDDFITALEPGLEAIKTFAPDALLVSLGLDAQANDPLAFLDISVGGFGRTGSAIAGLGLPTVLVQEGGYLCDDLGDNLVSFVSGFEKE